MAIVDIIILGIILISCVLGVFRGLIKEALSLAFWIGAAVLASVFKDLAAAQLTGLIDTPVLRQIAGFVLIFIVTVILGGLISNLLSKLMSKAGLGGVDRALGALFGIIRGVVIVAVIVMMTAQLQVTRDIYGESVLVPYVMVLSDFFLDLFGVDSLPPLDETIAGGRELPGVSQGAWTPQYPVPPVPRANFAVLPG